MFMTVELITEKLIALKQFFLPRRTKEISGMKQNKWKWRHCLEYMHFFVSVFKN